MFRHAMTYESSFNIAYVFAYSDVKGPSGPAYIL